MQEVFAFGKVPYTPCWREAPPRVCYLRGSSLLILGYRKGASYSLRNDLMLLRNIECLIPHSDRRLFTGSLNAALTL